ncbi:MULTISPECIES: Gfo/Idh/MocA family oxidoreductase [unclassified Roseibium]|uniref:Gfo/Idh/MocA family oxidoreductase n=1 Tax=unclassified Roseibium TaxID=2629323 RepID=UPI00316C338C
MTRPGLGLIGTGFIGKCHALAYGSVKAVFGDVPAPRLEVLCDVPAGKAALSAGKHVHLEKPMVLTLDDARDMLKEAEQTGRKPSSATVTCTTRPLPTRAS